MSNQSISLAFLYIWVVFYSQLRHYCCTLKLKIEFGIIGKDWLYVHLIFFLFFLYNQIFYKCKPSIDEGQTSFFVLNLMC